MSPIVLSVLLVRCLVLGLAGSPDEAEGVAERLFARGDYPGCERVLREALAAGSVPPAARAAWLARLAEVCALQGAAGEAKAAIAEALTLDPSPFVRRAAVSVHLQAQSFSELLPHVDALLREGARDPFLFFARGVARARAGEFEKAVSDLSLAAADPGLHRDARFELALAHAKRGEHRPALLSLREILERDPYDAEAVHQASRQLLQAGGREARRTAAHLIRYFDTLRGLEGLSSREAHLAAAGDAVGAALERAARWERLGAWDRLLDELVRPGDAGDAGGAGDAGEARSEAAPIALHLAGFWLRRGLLAEASAVARREGSAPTGEEGAPVARLLEAIEARGRKLDEAREDGGSALDAARARLAGVRWSEARPALEELLAAAAGGAAASRAGASGRAGAPGEGGREALQEAARLLLAREPSSRRALEALIAGAAEPSLIALRLHYSARAAAAAPADASSRERLERLRRELEGLGAGAAGENE